MIPELEERIYQSVLREVLWGAERDKISPMLETNGITGEAAEKMFRRAWSERIALIRSEAIRQAVKGLLLLAMAIGLLCIFWFGVGWITSRLFVIFGLVGLWGLGLLLNGTVNALTAPKKKGSAIPES